MRIHPASKASLTYFEVVAGLTHFDEVAVRIADVGADLVAEIDRFGQEPGTTHSP